MCTDSPCGFEGNEKGAPKGSLSDRNGNDFHVLLMQRFLPYPFPCRCSMVVMANTKTTRRVTKGSLLPEGWNPLEPHRCQANTRAGPQCPRAAIRGLTVCRWHGGQYPNVRVVAAKRVARAEAERDVTAWLATQDIAPATDPIGTFLRLIAVLEEDMAYRGAELADLGRDYRYLSSTGTEQVRAEFMAFKDARDAYYAAVAMWNKLGLEERRIALQESQAEAVAAAVGAIVSGVLSLVKPHVPAEQWHIIETESVPALQKRHLSALD